MANIRATLFGLMVFAALAGFSATAKADRFYGPHPVIDSFTGHIVAGTWCNDTGYHSHEYPADPSAFALEGDSYLFLGNPQDYGYSGQVYTYSGPHALDSFYRDGWCPQEGVHTHFFQPYASADWGYQNNIYYYQGPPTAYSSMVFPLVTIVRPTVAPGFYSYPHYGGYGFGGPGYIGGRPPTSYYHYGPGVSYGSYGNYGRPYGSAPIITTTRPGGIVQQSPTYITASPGVSGPRVFGGRGGIVTPPSSTYNTPSYVPSYPGSRPMNYGSAPNVVVGGPTGGYAPGGRIDGGSRGPTPGYSPAPIQTGGGFRGGGGFVGGGFGGGRRR